VERQLGNFLSSPDPVYIVVIMFSGTDLIGTGFVTETDV